MREMLEIEIERKARAALRAQRVYAARQLKFASKFRKRTGLPAGRPTIGPPSWWSTHPHFDPIYCIKHRRFLARVIWQKLQRGDYAPTPAIQFDIPKPDGSTRQIMAFTIPDSALANIIHKKATTRNTNLFSSYSYAYRSDKSIFDALITLRRSLVSHKSYVIQYDFKKYFDSIDHAYIERVLFDQQLFILSAAERVAIRAFLKHRYASFPTYAAGNFQIRESGVPQGSSLSLFLSNAAAHELDLSLEKQNGSFVRFADDVVAVTHTFTDALDVAAQFRAHCKAAGLKINFDKSPGIKLFQGPAGSEHRDLFIDKDDAIDAQHCELIDYLGHRITSLGISMPDKSVKRIKRRIAELIYQHLFLHRRGAGGAFNPARIGPGGIDWDLLTCVMEIRRYMYGGLRESHLRAFLEEGRRLPRIKGLMSFFPLCTDARQLVELDGWLLNVMSRAQRERVRVLAAHGHAIPTLTRTQLRTGSWYAYELGVTDATLPSFVRAWRASRKHYKRFGLSGIKPPRYYSLLEY